MNKIAWLGGHWLIGGILSGLFLGLVLWIADRVGALGLLDLLLDDSFLPIIGPGSNRLVEWSLHLLTSVLLYIAFSYLSRRFNLARTVMWGAGFGAISSLIYVPLSNVSGAVLRPGWEGPIVWFAAHIAWGALVGLLYAARADRQVPSK